MSDLESIGDDYYKTLQELTFNSKPLITTLTILAQENIPAAKFITQAISKRISKCIPQHKLYALYILDSVCKNIGSPYTILISPNLANLFIETYTLVDESQRRKMTDLFKTWKVAKSTSGLPLFPQEPIKVIEKFLTKVQSGSLSYSSPRFANSQMRSGLPTQQSFPPQKFTPPSQNFQAAHIEQPGLQYQPSLGGNYPSGQGFQPQLGSNFQQGPALPAVPFFQQAPIYEQRGNFSPQKYKPMASSIPKTPLVDDKKPTTASLLKDIDNLQSLVGAKLSSNPNDTTSAQKLVIIKQLKNVLSTQNLSPDQLVPIKKQIQTLLESNKSKVNVRTVEPAQKPTPIVSFPQTAPGLPNIPKKSPPPIDVDSLFKRLQTTGLINMNNTGTSTKTTTPNISLPPKPQIPPKSVKRNQNLLNLPTSSILQDILAKTASKSKSKSSLDLSDFELTNESIESKISKISKFQKLLFQKKPLKCNNCGKRFSKKSESQDHLDWHFRINKRLKDPSRISCRSHYLDFAKFSNFLESEILGDVEVASEEIGDNAVQSQSTPDSHYLVIPEDSLDMTSTCNICKDTLKGVWDDEKGEWIWSNAIEVSGKIYHWTCYNETQKAGENTLKRKAGEIDRSVKKPALNGLNFDLSMLKSLSGISGKSG